jgi:hypothetical protein
MLKIKCQLNSLIAIEFSPAVAKSLSLQLNAIEDEY